MMRRVLFFSPLLLENLKVSLQSVRYNKLRSSLTIAIIAIGITSVVGTMTAVDALKSSVTDSFGNMGVNSFYIKPDYSLTTSGEHSRKMNGRLISYSQAVEFTKRYKYPAISSIFANLGFTETFKTQFKKSDPRMGLIAGDDNYLSFNSIKLDHGRNISQNDLDEMEYNCVIGSRTATMLFGKEEPVGQTIMARGKLYTVVGVAKAIGETFESFDPCMLIPITNARMSFLNERSEYQIGVKALPGRSVKDAATEAEIVFRAIRRLKPTDKTDFSIENNDEMIAQVDKIMNNVTLTALAVGLITMLGAAIGLMNIMLVSVKERTREIGVRKALGATPSLIRQQFFMEAVAIGQIGGAIGIIIGVTAANIILLALHQSAVLPWFWVVAGVIICLIVSAISGYMPARKAASLDPIESLRYE